MSDSNLTLRDLLGVRGAEIWALVEQRNLAGGLMGVMHRLPGFSSEAIASTIASSLDRVLAMDLARILAGAWTKYRELARYRDREKYPPEDTFLVALHRHPLTSSHRPTIEILADGTVVYSIELEIVLVLTLEAFNLEVRDGKIRAIVAGRLRGKGSLKAFGVTLVEKETSSVDLPGRIRLGDGIAIPGP